jgi:osmotically-inducible protein OsmY
MRRAKNNVEAAFMFPTQFFARVAFVMGNLAAADALLGVWPRMYRPVIDDVEEIAMAMIAQKDQGHLSYPYGDASSDEEILSEILNALHHNTGVPQERVRVEVRNGHAVLSGVLEQEFERELAERIAQSASGVVKVTNEIALKS